MDNLDKRMNSLPLWASSYIKELRLVIENRPQQLRVAQDKIAALELRYKRLKGKADAMEAILTCAAKGENETAAAYVARIIDEYKYDETEGM